MRNSINPRFASVKNLFFAIVSLALVINAYAQAPQAVKYQAVARDAGGNLLTTQSAFAVEAQLELSNIRKHITQPLINSGSLPWKSEQALWSREVFQDYHGERPTITWKLNWMKQEEPVTPLWAHRSC